MMNSYLLQLASFLILSLLLASCSKGHDNQGYNLEYWSSNNGGEIIFSQWAVERWNQAHPEKPVKYQPVPEGQSSEEIILAAVVGKTTPDIYSNIWQGSVEFYSQAGILVPLDTLEGFMDFIQERCSPETIREITSGDGHIYQMPWKVNPIMTIYNKGILASLQLGNLPQTYSAYLDAARQFQKDTDGDGYVDQWFGNTSVKLAWYQRLFNFYPLYLAASDGAPLIKDNRAAFNNEYAIGAFRFLQKVYQENYFSKEQQSAGQDLFIAEKIATKFTGPWEIQYLEKYKRDQMEYGFFPMPVPDGHSGPVYTYCDPKSMVVFNTCRNPQLAFEFIRTMVDRAGDLMFLETTYQLPRRQGIDSIPEFRDFFLDNPRLQVFAQQARHIRGVDNCEVLTEVFDIISQEYEACVLYQVKSPEQAIADAEQAVNVLLRVKD
ncbi:MAG: extracellular solute-binding protein [Lewinellaceae bacterium]|nr:extracellular solute-binding protein [Phaeodactylibacter sp.]MCB9041662.1 extracellular solute-binding protein [Lewinellaceae bacterium]